MQVIPYNEKFFIENYSHVDDDDELYLKYDWSSDTMSIKSNASDSALSTDPDGSGERLSLAYEKLTQIPRKIAEKFSRTTTILDLSYNNLKDLSFLSYFRQLNTLILDKNPQPDEKTFPSLPNLELLWINHCDIANVQNWVHRIRDCCPSLRYLSLLGNPGATSSFNGNSTLEHNDYRMMVISILPQLRYLDDAEVTEAQRVQAKQFRHNFNLSQTPFNIFESIGRAEQMGKKAAQKKALATRGQGGGSGDS
ncbi:leucine-rich melanocyte differentiation-associated protein-like isoform X2 [Toxorhynchites rutilus septentrionalis]|uniref:leucine-rich melanocyte differentiation-associated protein-like isoform X2 n=1 Tax=Toxorhynchites rutilus septentrionalis TaxID=329112 RepID=UPI0024798933|nr:leucine-rich melanocyte differentiation-associated protein-like isoform X2 [Toxorhynchites rutilus septentrionalis]